MKKRYSRTLLIATAALAATSTQALANPNGGSVIAGQATIAQTAPAQVTITQSTDKAIINWNSFSIGAGEKTRFVQPSSNSITLNRVTGPDVSQILGQLTANGRIVLVNPNGVFFDKDSQVDVAALIATTHDIKNDDFLAGKLNFTIPGKPGAQVINQGKITVQEGGLVALVAPSVQNSGLITARLGKVALASANSFTIDLYGDDLILFEADSAITSQLKDALGNPLSAAVENNGAIEANGGWVLLTAEVAKNVVDKAINMTGHIKATTVDQQEGTIILKAMGGEVAMSGTLDASAPNGGDGGFIETSGAHVSIDPMLAKISTAAPYGSGGQWLIDPRDYYIAASGGDIKGADLGHFLELNNIIVMTSSSGSGYGDIYVNDSVYWTSLSKLTLNAHRNININSPINSAGGGSVLLRADSDGSGSGTVTFAGNGHITVTNNAAIGIYYNPTSYTDAATRSDNSVNPYSSKVTRNGGSTMKAFMLVNDVTHLQAMNTNLSGQYALGKNIDASATAGWNGGRGFMPVGAWFMNGILSVLHPFVGTLDGLGHAISGLTINNDRPDTNLTTGLFGVIKSGGQVSNVIMQGIMVKGDTYVGGLVGVLDYGGVVSRCAVGGNVTGRSNAVGGVVGYNYAGNVSNCYTVGNISGQGGVGGIVGLNRATVANSYAAGKVTANYWAGGVAGTDEGGQGHVINSYWDIDFGLGVSSGGAGLTSAQMMRQASYSGWDFTNTWRITDGSSFPLFRNTASSSNTGTTLLLTFGSPNPYAVDSCSANPASCGNNNTSGSDSTTGGEWNNSNGGNTGELASQLAQQLGISIEDAQQLATWASTTDTPLAGLFKDTTKAVVAYQVGEWVIQNLRPSWRLALFGKGIVFDHGMYTKTILKLVESNSLDTAKMSLLQADQLAVFAAGEVLKYVAKENLSPVAATWAEFGIEEAKVAYAVWKAKKLGGPQAAAWVALVEQSVVAYNQWAKAYEAYHGFLNETDKTIGSYTQGIMQDAAFMMSAEIYKEYDQDKYNSTINIINNYKNDTANRATKDFDLPNITPINDLLTEAIKSKMLGNYATAQSYLSKAREEANNLEKDRGFFDYNVISYQEYVEAVARHSDLTNIG